MRGKSLYDWFLSYKRMTGKSIIEFLLILPIREWENTPIKNTGNESNNFKLF